MRALMYYALKVWSDIAPLDFHEVAGNMADIQVDFSRAAHDDRFPFDGPGGTLAHAFLPGDNGAAGDTHFDDDEIWTFRSSGKWLGGSPHISACQETQTPVGQAAGSPQNRIWVFTHCCFLSLGEAPGVGLSLK